MNLIEAKTSGDLGEPTTLRVPLEWHLVVRGQAREESLAQLRSMASVFQRGGESFVGLYRRLAAHVRDYELDPPEVKAALKAAQWPAPRVSELLAVAYAKPEIYKAYQAGLGFRVALEETRRARASDVVKESWRSRQWRRAAARVIRLVEKLGWKAEPWECCIPDGPTQSRLHITNRSVQYFLLKRLGWWFSASNDDGVATLNG